MATDLNVGSTDEPQGNEAPGLPTEVDPAWSDLSIEFAAADPLAPGPARQRDPAASRRRPAVGGSARLRSAAVGGTATRASSSSSGRRRRRKGVDRRARRLRGILVLPDAVKLERSVLAMMLVAAALVVAGVAAAGIRSEITDSGRFVEHLAPLHRDRAVAEETARLITNDLATNRSVEADQVDMVNDAFRDLVESERFEPAWRSAMRAAHSEAFRGDRSRPPRLSSVIPGLGASLHEDQAPVRDLVTRSTTLAVSRAYAAELSTVERTLHLVVYRGLPLAAVIVVMALSRTRNRYRALVTLAASAMVGALLVAALAPLLGSLVISTVVADEVRSLASGALSALVPPVRIVLFGLAAVAGAVMVGARLEEARTTRFRGARSGRRRRR